MHELRLVLTAVALVAAMLLAERLGRRERLAAAILVLISIAWLTVDKRWEIAVLVRVSHSHGLTVTDLVGIAGLLRGGWLLLRPARRRTPHEVSGAAADLSAAAIPPAPTARRARSVRRGRGQARR